jgi:TonB family protein
MDELSAKTYKARRYASGSSDAETISVSVRDDEFHIVDSQNAEAVLPMTAVSLKLGGSSSDRVILEIQKSGETIIVNDLEFLKVLKQAQATSNITRQASKAQTARTFDKLRGLVFIGVMLGVVFLFGGCLFIAIILEPERESHEAAKTASNGSPATGTDSEISAPSPFKSSLPQPQTPEFAAEQAYRMRIKKILLQAWPPPPKNDFSVVLVQMKLAKDGTVENVSIVQSAGNKVTDSSALAAVKKSSPLPAPPAHWKEPIEIQFTFNPMDRAQIGPPIETQPGGSADQQNPDAAGEENLQ